MAYATIAHLDQPVYPRSQLRVYDVPLRKHAYSNKLKILPLKDENFQIKNSDIFHISAQNIDLSTR